jgi:prophage antirepressor-like protein
MSNIVPLNVFTYKETIEHPVRHIMQNSEIWFLAADICETLDIANVSDAVEKLDDDEKITIAFSDSNRGNPNKLFISLPGFYKLSFRSNKPQAKDFTRWVTHEVLPAIYKTGSYSLPSQPQVKLLHPTSTRYELSTADTQQMILDYVARLQIPSARDLSRYITRVPVQDLRLWLHDLSEQGLLKTWFTGHTWRYKRAN